MYRERLLKGLNGILGRGVSVDEGMSALTQFLGGLLPELATSEPIIIAVAGGTASGKTSQIADRFSRSLPDMVTIVPVDMFYRGARALKAMEDHHGRPISWDEPLAVDLEAAAQQLLRLKQGQLAQVPVYDFSVSERTGTTAVLPRPIIIVEGLFALHDVIRQHADLSLYVDVDIHGQIIRRVLRDITRKRREPNDILLNLAEVAIPLQYEYVTTTRQFADIIINNDYRPETESARQGSTLPQLKVAGWPLQGALTELRAEYICTFSSYDRYFTSHDRNLEKSGEEFRFREESDRLMLTYKGPLTGALGERFVLTCSIDEGTFRALTRFYRETLVYVQKTRRLFLLEGALIGLDDVTLKNPQANGPESMHVTEVRLTGHQTDDSVATNIIKRLGLNPERSTPASYFSIALNPSLLPLE